MALEPRDRENLLAEATALVRRIELELSSGESIVVGFRRSGEASVYFASDPVYQFNDQQHLRRAYIADQLLKADRSMLVRIERTRMDGRVVLKSQPLSPAEATAVLAEMSDRLGAMTVAIQQGAYRVVGQVPPEIELISEVIDWLGRLPVQAIIAEHAGLR